MTLRTELGNKVVLETYDILLWRGLELEFFVLERIPRRWVEVTLLKISIWVFADIVDVQAS